MELDGSNGGRRDRDAVPRLAGRIDDVEQVVRRWATADTLDEARKAAQQAAALIAGPGGAEADGNGVAVGVLPTLEGGPVAPSPAVQPHRRERRSRRTHQAGIGSVLVVLHELGGDGETAARTDRPSIGPRDPPPKWAAQRQSLTPLLVAGR